MTLADRADAIDGQWWVVFILQLCAEGHKLVHRSFYRQAQRIYAQAHKHAESFGDDVSRALALGGIGVASWGIGSFHISLQAFDRLFAMGERWHNEQWLMMACAGIGNARIALGQNADAIQILERQKSIAESRSDKLGLCEAAGNLGTAHLRLGAYCKALAFHQDALQLATELDEREHPGAQAQAMDNLGATYLRIGEYKKAIDMHTKALELAVQQGSAPAKARAHGNLGQALFAQGDYHNAGEQFGLQLATAQPTEDMRTVSAAYWGIGRVYEHTGKLEEAAKQHRKALGIVQVTDDKAAQARIYGGLACLSRAQGRYAEAIKLFETQLTICKALDDKSALLEAHVGLARACAHAGDMARSLEHFEAFGALLKALDASPLPAAFWEQYARAIDEWTLVTARVSGMMEALRVEEWRRCRSELSARADREGEVRSVEEYAIRVEASHVIVLRVAQVEAETSAALMVWVLSGSSGELVYSDIRVLEDVASIRQCIAGATFATWDDCRQRLNKAKGVFREREGVPRGHGEESVVYNALQKVLCERYFPEAVKEYLPLDLWTALRTPTQAVRALTIENYERARRHNFLNAQRCLEELSALIWDPILKQCDLFAAAGLGKRKRSQREKPVSTRATAVTGVVVAMNQIQ